MTLLARIAAVSCFVVVAIVLSSILGWHIASFMEPLDDDAIVSIEPSHLELVSPIEEGKTLQLPLMLVNTTNGMIHVQHISTTCGCTRISTRGDREVSVPFAVGAGESIPLQVAVNTALTQGDKAIAVAVNYDLKGVSYFVTSEIVIHILPGLRCLSIPGILVDPGIDKTIVQSVIIGDSFAGDGIDIESAVSSLRKIVNVELKRIPQTPAFVTGKGSPEWQKRFKKRYEVSFSFDCRNDPFDGTIVVKPKNTAIAPLHIPIKYLGWQGRPKVFPDEVLISRGNHRQLVEQEVRVVSSSGHPLKAIYPLAAPKWINIDVIRHRENEWLIRLLIQPLGANGKAAVVTLGDRGSSAIVEIPVRFVGTLEN